MKKLALLLTVVTTQIAAFAAHITGGEMYYTLVSQSGGNFTYQVTLKLYRDCFSTGAQLDPSAPIAIFNSATNAMVWSQSVPKTQEIRQNLSSPNPCIQNPPAVCYDVGFYTFTVTLPGIASGYTIAYQRCCRIAGINNVSASSSSGATYTATIPGTFAGSSAPANNSANFRGVDTVIICANNNFCYDFGASDPDGDSLVYSFSNAYVGGSQGAPAPNPPNSPPYSSVPYSAPYSAFAPLGAGVSINRQTGLMCGVAPPGGIYVVTVAVQEYRNGVLIATQRKDLQIKVGDCNVADAELKPEYITCDGFTYTFSNEAPPNPLVKTYYWELGDGFTSTEASPTHTFADTGIYSIKLVVNRNQECSDSVISQIKVYPGFFPGFTTSGVCVNKPTQFIDTTNTRYGVVDSWRWNFGDPATTADTSRNQNPVYTFSQAGTYNVTFIVTNSKGCIDTVNKDVEILVKPPLSVAFDDTLICRSDSVQLQAIGNGVFSWTPVTNIDNPNVANPRVFPPVSTDYIVKLDDQGCIAFDTVKVRVVDFVSLQAMPDTVICTGDSLRLYAFTNGNSFLWDNAATLDDPTLLRPLARPVNNPTTYTITARIGSCRGTDNVTVTMVPYPVANAGADTTICFETPAQLNGSHNGTSFSWSPTETLTNASTLTPEARPKVTTAYVLSAFDTQGCPKPGHDTVVVTVNPEILAYAGVDTAVVVGQNLQLTATGGETYVWSPATGLNDPFSATPVGRYDGSFDSIRYFVTVSDAIGCTDVTSVLVKIFKTNPKIFVPTAFTPNGDGKNDVVRPIAVGISKIEYFRIFNRWGQKVFETTVNGKGWDGRINGQEQASATFVWIVKGVDFTGKVVTAKGQVTLIR